MDLTNVFKTIISFKSVTYLIQEFNTEHKCIDLSGSLLWNGNTVSHLE